jgi:CTD small phosphatase-like protein 2
LFNFRDLNLLGRNLSKTIIIDNIEENFNLTKSNGIVCNTWKDNINDKDLLYLSEILKSKIK